MGQSADTVQREKNDHSPKIDQKKGDNPMLKHAVAILVSAALMLAAPAFAVDGVVLINQSDAPYEQYGNKTPPCIGVLIVRPQGGIPIYCEQETLGRKGRTAVTAGPELGEKFGS
jgi:hypothetical protein